MRITIGQRTAETYKYLHPSTDMPSKSSTKSVQRTHSHAVPIAGIVRLARVLYAMHRPAHYETRTERALEAQGERRAAVISVGATATKEALVPGICLGGHTLSRGTYQRPALDEAEASIDIDDVISLEQNGPRKYNRQGLLEAFAYSSAEGQQTLFHDLYIVSGRRSNYMAGIDRF